MAVIVLIRVGDAVRVLMDNEEEVAVFADAEEAELSMLEHILAAQPQQIVNLEI